MKFVIKCLKNILQYISISSIQAIIDTECLYVDYKQNEKRRPVERLQDTGDLSQ